MKRTDCNTSTVGEPILSPLHTATELKRREEKWTEKENDEESVQPSLGQQDYQAGPSDKQSE